MKVMMLLLLSTVALLVSTAVVSPVPQKPEQNLSELIKVAERYNKSLTMVRAHLVSTNVFLLVNLFLQQFNAALSC